MVENFWHNKNVLVTGATGFIGSWLAKELVEKKAKVCIIMRDLKSLDGLKLQRIEEKVTKIQGDLIDYSLLSRVLNEYEIDTVFHLGAQTLVGVANNNPFSTFESNIRGSYCLLEAIRNSKTVNGTIFASSDKAYGIHEKLPYVEDYCLNAYYPYDVSKACAEMIARTYCKTYGLKIAITRNANTYGGCDLNFSRIVPATIKSLIEGNPPIIRSDGRLERDYLYVKDSVQGYLLLGENISRKEVSGEAFNFGLGKPVKVIDLVEKICKLSNSKLKPKIMNTAKNEIEKQYLDTKKAKKLLGWKPEYSLETGLTETISWYTDYFGKCTN